MGASMSQIELPSSCQTPRQEHSGGLQILEIQKKKKNLQDKTDKISDVILLLTFPTEYLKNKKSNKKVDNSNLLRFGAVIATERF